MVCIPSPLVISATLVLGNSIVIIIIIIIILFCFSASLYTLFSRGEMKLLLLFCYVKALLT